MSRNKQDSKRCIQVYTGDGKGKTTAALGLALRALGHGMHVKMILFMKGREDSGEWKIAKALPGFSMIRFGRGTFVKKDKPEEEDIRLARQGLETARKAFSEDLDLLILDEIHVAVDYGLIPVEDVVALMNEKPDSLELVLTGRKAHPEIVKKADLVSEILLIKHPYDSGAGARAGFDF